MLCQASRLAKKGPALFEHPCTCRTCGGGSSTQAAAPCSPGLKLCALPLLLQVLLPLCALLLFEAMVPCLQGRESQRKAGVG